MAECEVLWGFSGGCVAKVVCRGYETAWRPMSWDVCYALMWTEGDAWFLAHLALGRAARALGRASTHWPRSHPLGSEVRAAQRQVAALAEMPGARPPGTERYEGLLTQVRSTRLTPHEELVLCAAGLL